MPQIIDEHKPYLDEYGFIESSINNRSQNKARWTAQYLGALVRNNALTQEEQARLRKAFQSLEATSPGLLWRDPQKNGGQEGPDNLYASFYADSILGTGFSKRFLKYGRTLGANHLNTDSFHEKHPKLAKWIYNIRTLGGLLKFPFVFNNEDEFAFNTSAWVKQPALRIIAKVVAGERINFLEKLTWSVGCVLGAFQASSQDGKVLMWFQIKCMKNQGWLTSKAIAFWVLMFKRQWENGIGGVLKAYWNNEHPTIHWLNGEFGEF